MQGLYREYDDIMIGKKKNFSDRFFQRGAETNEKMALAVMKYAFVVYMKMKPDALVELLDRRLMDEMHLTGLMKYIPFPPEYDKKRDFYYIISLISRGHVLTNRDRVIHVYERVLNGELPKYPKDYFSGSGGMINAGICLDYMINHFVMYEDINHLYFLFASKKGFAFLKQYKLLKVCRALFDTPVDYLHFILPQDVKNEFFLRYYRFNYLLEVTPEMLRTKRPDKDYRLEVYS